MELRKFHPLILMKVADIHFSNLIIIDLKKRRMTLEGNGIKEISPLDPDEGCRYT
jgi:hypothetical protein